MASESTRLPTFLAMLLCVLLCAGLVYDHRKNTSQRDQFATALRQMSNSWHTASQKLEEQRVVNQTLEHDLAEALKAKTNTPPPVVPAPQVEVASASAAKVDPGPDPRIHQLEDERDGLSGRITDLSRSMCDLQHQITETQRRLEASEGDREALLRDLKRLQGEKSKLEEQFFNLAALREQMRKLRAEQAVSRRLEWIRRGLYGESKGSEMLRKGLASAKPASGNYNLDVEVHQSGGAKVVTPAN